MFVTCDVLIQRRARRHSRLFELHHHQRQTVDKPDQVRSAGVERTGHRHLANEQEIVRRRILPIDHAHAFGFLAAALAIRHAHFDAIFQQLVNITIRGRDAHCRSIACQVVNRGGDCLIR